MASSMFRIDRIEIISAGVVEVLTGDGLTADMETRMSRSESAAKAGAPVESGDYQASIHMWTERHGDRNVTHVGSDVPYAMIVEAATGNLARSLDAAGGG
jgi:hypothetical protein